MFGIQIIFDRRRRSAELLRLVGLRVDPCLVE
jgi:hypothetical protein